MKLVYFTHVCLKPCYVCILRACIHIFYFLFIYVFSAAEREKIGIPTVAEPTGVLTSYPTVVIYMVDPFTYTVDEDSNTGNFWLLGLIRCFTDMLEILPEQLRTSCVLQVCMLSCVLSCPSYKKKKKAALVINNLVN